MPKKLISVLVLLTFFPSVAMGLPAGGKVAGGVANINQPKGQTLNINQLSERAIINWKGFSIDVNELVRFTQPSSKSVVLNRVTGMDPSSILGRLAANGRVFIVNPNGILFGPNSRVDVAGLLATTLNINDNDFLAGKYNFSQDPNRALSYVINKGEIKIADNGFVFLVAPGVANEGLIIANLGKAVMASGQKLAVDFNGDGLITFAIEGKVLDRVLGPDGIPLTSAVNNGGTIRADGGQVALTAKASAEIFSSVVNNSGVIEARSLVNRGGVIRLEGSDPVANTGEIGWQNNLGKVQNAEGAVINTGRLDVSAGERGAAPGQVTLSGQMVGSSGTIAARAADGSQGGGVLITSTDKTVLTNDSQIDTSGAGNSSAGNVVVWSDNNTVFRGIIVAKGGETGGNGGQIAIVRIQGVTELHFRDAPEGKAKEPDHFQFFPDHLYTELIIGLVLMIVLSALATILPATLGPKADPLITPEVIKPEWYFYVAFRWLKLFSGTVAVLSMGFIVFAMLAWPFIDAWIRRRTQFQEASVWIGIAGALAIIGLTLWEAVVAH